MRWQILFDVFWVITGIVALGITYCIITGHIDVSSFNPVGQASSFFGLP